MMAFKNGWRSGVGVALVGLGLILGAPVVAARAAVAPRATWPAFRGPWSTGHTSAPGDTRPVGLPLAWTDTEHVVWKTAIPHLGWSTPVVWGDQVWLTAATADGHEFFAVCVDADTGKIAFMERLFHAGTPEPLGNPVNCYASPSPAIEAGRVYVHFGSYGTACLDTATRKVLWQRQDLPCRHYRGPASSVMLFENLVILSMDGVDVQYVVALAKADGRTVWKTDRSVPWTDLTPDGTPIREGDFRKAFCTPFVIEAAGRTQMISLGAKAGYAYDPRSGKELWRVQYKGHSAAPMPLVGHGLVYICTGLGKTELLAVRPDGRGDVTDTHVAWKVTKDVPGTASPVLVGDVLTMVSDSGVVTCLDARTGETVWRDRLSGNYAASPIVSDGRLYFFSRQGKTTVLKAGRTFEVLATSRLPASFMASPAVAHGALFLRTKTHLYRIEAGE